MSGSPIVTISALSRTFNLRKGGASATLSLTSRSAQPGSARIAPSAASMPSRAPAIVPLIPSCARSSVPFTPLAQQTFASGARSASGSSNRVNR